MRLYKILLFLGLTISKCITFTPTPIIPSDITVKIIKETGTLLSNIDIIGEESLVLNQIIIDFLLDNNYLNPEIKKSLIKYLINIAQEGDKMGTVFLSLYHELIMKLL
tara:strand:- start:4521 stop:4844 length:324 start_codon:yes stop_codon:yes gene_type:complete